MASVDDHTRRDAEHAARNEVSTCVGKFTRRINEAAKAAIKTYLESIPEGEVIDFDYGTSMGKRAAEAAILKYIFEKPESVTPRPLTQG